MQKDDWSFEVQDEAVAGGGEITDPASGTEDLGDLGKQVAAYRELVARNRRFWRSR